MKIDNVQDKLLFILLERGHDGNKTNIYDYDLNKKEPVAAELINDVVILLFDDYLDIEYSDITRKRNAMSVTKHVYAGIVVAYDEYENDEIVARVYRGVDHNKEYSVMFPELPDKRFLKGDEVRVYRTLIQFQLSETGQPLNPIINVDRVYLLD